MTWKTAWHLVCVVGPAWLTINRLGEGNAEGAALCGLLTGWFLHRLLYPRDTEDKLMGRGDG